MKKLLLVVVLAAAIHSLHAQTEFSQDSALQHLKKLAVEIGPRPMGSPAERRAMEYAIAKFREHGCDTAYIMNMPYSSRANTTSGIAIGIRHGATGRMIVIGGHIDSAGPEIPGADDDGSGSATVIELSRVLCRRPMQSTLVFCCWGSEEQGLEGSKYFADHFERLDSVDLMLQIDMANGDGLIELDPDTHGASAPQWLTRATVKEFYALGYSHLRYPTHFFSMNYARAAGSGSDHESFLQKGIPAIDLSTDVAKPIHTPRDNFENFDPSGLKRSGDVMLKLVERFDHGIPSRSTERYLLFLIGRTPLFIPFPWIWAFVAFTVLLSIAAFIAVRRRREPPDSPGRIRWSGIKMTLFAFLILLCGWFSSDLIGLARGVRFPWMVTLPEYYVLSTLGICIGIWIVLRWSKHLKLSNCPYVFAKRAMIILLLFIGTLGFLSVKLLVEPAMGLFLLSLAILFRNSFLKIVLAILAPAWMIRLAFSEWSPILFRSTASALPGDFGTWVFFNGIVVVLFTLILLPFLFGFAAVIRDSGALQMLISPLRSFVALYTALFAFITLGGYLYTQPVNDRYWYRNVTIEQSYDMNTSSKECFLRGGEYLSGVRVRASGADTMITARTTIARFTPRDAFDTTWLAVNRKIENVQSGDSLLHNIELTLSMSRRPYTVSVVYTSRKDKVASFDTPWKFSNERGTRTIQWYSFPDSILKIPVSFTTAGSDSVKERIEVTFDTLASPMSVEREMTYFLPRTKYTQVYVYRR